MQWPVSADERDEKFLDCATRVLGGAGAKRALDLAVNAQSLANVAELARALVPAKERVKAPRAETASAMAK